MTRRIVVHPGFHKTGTSTAQRLLWRNRELIWPVAALVLADRMAPALAAAKDYSSWGDRRTLEAFGAHARTLLSALDLGERRGAILSAENLGGHPPGRGGVRSYGDAAPDLMAELRRAVLRTWPDAHLVFVVGTRGRNAWLASAWWQQLKQGRMVLDEAEFAAAYGEGAKLRRALRAVRKAVAPTPVREARLEEVGGWRLGPAGPLLDALAIGGDRRARFEALLPQNARPAGYRAIAARLLEVNRTVGDPGEARRARKALLAANGLG